MSNSVFEEYQLKVFEVSSLDLFAADSAETFYKNCPQMMKGLISLFILPIKEECSKERFREFQYKYLLSMKSECKFETFQQTILENLNDIKRTFEYDLKICGSYTKLVDNVLETEIENIFTLFSFYEETKVLDINNECTTYEDTKLTLYSLYDIR